MSEAPLVVHIIYSLDTGGLENGLVNIINRMPASAYRHRIVCLDYCNPEFARRITREDVQVVALNKAPGKDWNAIKRLRDLLREWRPAIVHSRNIAALEMQFVTLGLWGLKRIHGEHGRDFNDLDGRNWKYNLLRRLSSLCVHRYIAVSRDLQQWMAQVVHLPRRKLFQIYNGVDVERFSPLAEDARRAENYEQETPQSLIFGSVGRLNPVKDQQLLIRALAQLAEQQPQLAVNLRLWLIGDGPLMAELVALATELGVSDRVWFAGDRSDIPQLLQRLDVFVLPSLAEGISNTLLEAMASGLPVVASEVGGNPEIVQDGAVGRLFPRGDLKALVEHLTLLLEDSEARQSLGAKARQQIESRFNWRSCVSHYQAMYDQVLGREGTDSVGSTHTI